MSAFVVGLLVGVLVVLFVGGVLVHSADDPTGMGAMLEAIRAEDLEIADPLEEEFRLLEAAVARRATPRRTITMDELWETVLPGAWNISGNRFLPPDSEVP